MTIRTAIAKTTFSSDALPMLSRVRRLQNEDVGEADHE